MWSAVNFGKWRGKGKTLPQILVVDPDWFFWAFEEGVFSKKGSLAKEAETLNRRARSIKIPAKAAPQDRVQYWFGPDGKFSHIALVESTQPAHHGSSSEMRRDHLDLHVPRAVKQYDKLGCKLLLSGFKFYWLKNKPFTKAAVEGFFADAKNFQNP